MAFKAAFKCALEGRSRSRTALRQNPVALKSRNMPYDNGVRRHLVIKFEFDFLGKLSLGNARILGASFKSLSLDETLPRAGGLNPPTFSGRVPVGGVAALEQAAREARSP